MIINKGVFTQEFGSLNLPSYKAEIWSVNNNQLRRYTRYDLVKQMANLNRRFNLQATMKMLI